MKISVIDKYDMTQKSVYLCVLKILQNFFCTLVSKNGIKRHLKTSCLINNNFTVFQNQALSFKQA